MSLATKLRPKTLDEVVGQKAVVKSIKKTLERKEWPKSWLFVGPSGCGKTTIARILANIFAGGKANQSNIIEVDMATNSGAEATRDLVQKANYRALGESPVKTIICDEVHRCSAAAWSSLLKPIEEPPSHVFWVLCTTETGKIPDTIKNRCVTFTLKPVGDLELFEFLEKINNLEKLHALPEVLEAIVDDSKGSPRQALSYLESCAHAKTVSEAKELMKSALHTKEAIDLARFIISKNSKSWTDAARLVNSIENIDAEGVRITIANYVAAALLKAKSDNEAHRFLSILECFSTPYPSSDKLAPLLMSIGLALGLDKGN